MNGSQGNDLAHDSGAAYVFARSGVTWAQQAYLKASIPASLINSAFRSLNAGPKTAILHITSNDADESPFDVNLTGHTLTFTQDTDGDGLNDASELQIARLGFD